MSQLAGDLADESAAIDLADAATNLAGPDSKLTAAAAIYAAYGHGLRGQSAASLGVLDEALDMLADQPPATLSPWAVWLDASYVGVQRARCLAVLGDHRGGARTFGREIQHLPPSFPPRPRSLPSPTGGRVRQLG